MNKKLFRFISACLCTTCLFSFAGCDNVLGGDLVGGEKATEIKEFGDYDGLHVYNKTEIANSWLVKDGKTEYRIVLPDSTHSRVALARSDFKALFLEATGVSIASLKEDDVTDVNNGKYIFIGCQKVEQSVGLNLQEGLPKGKSINAQGFRIKTVGDDLFIMAKDQNGALWGTYELLTQLFDYERYGVDLYEINKVDNLPLFDFDVMDNPDFETRIGPWGPVYKVAQATNASRMRFVLQHQDVYVGKTRYHNTLEYLRPDKNMTDNKEWYAQMFDSNELVVYDESTSSSKNVFQLCYTAHGNAEKYNAMVTAMANACIEELKLDTTSPIITITQEDNREFCTCDACEAGTQKYGGRISGNMWKFHLDVVRKINAWLEVNQPGRKETLRIAMFAYHNYQEAPAYLDDNGVWQTYEGLDATKDSAISNAAIFCALSSADRLHGLTREEYNKKTIDATQSWKPCTNNSGVWMYQTDYQDYLIPTDSFNYQEDYKLCLDFGAKWIFDQGQQDNLNLTGFNNLKLYLNSKLQWNVDLDVDKLISDYFKATFGPAAEVMFNYFIAQRAHMQTLPPSEIEENMTTIENFPYNVVVQWLNFVDNAYKAIEHLKDTDAVAYKTYYDNICEESITARYLFVIFHGGTVGDEKLEQMQSSFKEDVLRLNFTECAQHVSIDELIKNW